MTTTTPHRGTTKRQPRKGKRHQPTNPAVPYWDRPELQRLIVHNGETPAKTMAQARDLLYGFSQGKGRATGIYLRISDDREGRELGIERQLWVCLQQARNHGDRVVDVYSDNDVGASTKSSKRPRPDYKRLLADAASHRLRQILAYTSNRLTRRPMELEDQITVAEDYATRFEYVASPSFDLNTAAGRRVARILAANDAGEAEDISERTRAEKKARRARGEYTGGGRAFGYVHAVYDARGNITNRDEIGRKLIKVEADAIRDGVERVLAGESLYSLEQLWQASIQPVRDGSGWRQENIRRILMNPRNAGLVAYEGNVLEGVKAEWDAIITVAEWKAVCDILNDPKRTTYTGSRSLKWVGTNLYICGKCGDVVQSAGVSLRGPGGQGVAAYRCKTLHLSIRAEQTDDHVRNAVVRYLEQYGAALLDETPDAGEYDRLSSEANQVRERLDGFARMFGAGEFKTKREYDVATEVARNQLDNLNVALAAYSAGSVLAGVADVDDKAGAYDGLPITRKRSVVDKLFTVTIMAGKRGRRPKDEFDYGRIKIKPR